MAVLGLAYKPDIDDLRESPAVEVARMFHEQGAVVSAFEPYKLDAIIPDIQLAPTLEAALAEADMVVLLVAHQCFLSLRPEQMAAMTPARAVIDTVNGWDAKGWEQAGFTMIRLGGANR